MNYCTHCGTPAPRFEVPPGDHRPRFYCAQCHTTHYQNPKVVAGCLPVYQGQVLLCRRGIGPREGFWNLPAGFMEMGESLEAAAQRETFEETGAQVKLGLLHSVYSVVHVNQVIVHFLAEMESPYFRPTAESPEIAFFSPEHIPWSELAFTSNAFSLEKFQERLRNPTERVYIGTYLSTEKDPGW